MIELQNYTYLMIFPDGTVFEGKKLLNICNHYEILELMQKEYPDFNLMTDSYDFRTHKEQIKFYNHFINNGGIIYHAWSTYIEEYTEDVNIYLPNQITAKQKDYLNTIIDQLYAINNIIPHEIREKGILEMSNYTHFEGAKYIDNYIDEHLIKSK